MVRRVGSFAVLVLLATFVLAACGSEQGEVEPTVTRIPDAANMPVVGETPESGETAAEEPAIGGEAAAGGTTFDVEMVDIAFTEKELVVPANTEITVNLVNSGAAVHNFIIDELGVASEDFVAGQTGTVTFNTGAPGEHEYYCSIPGHREAGMVGKLIVVEGGAEPVADEAGAASPVAAGDEAASPVPASPVAAGGEELPTTIDVELLDIRFDQTEITIPANTDVTINATNAGAAVHNFVITDTEFATRDLAGGESESIVVNLPPGEYEYVCTIPGHREAGMVGTLIVVEGGGAAADGEPAAAGEEAPAGGEAAATSLDVALLDIRFDQTELTIPANTDVTIHATNEGAAIHNFVITDTDFATRDLAGGESESIVVNLPPGEYEYVCTIPGHREAGMVGTLIVR